MCSPERKSRALDRNPRHGDSQSIPRSRRGNCPCGENSTSESSIAFGSEFVRGSACVWMRTEPKSPGWLRSGELGCADLSRSRFAPVCIRISSTNEMLPSTTKLGGRGFGSGQEFRCGTNYAEGPNALACPLSRRASNPYLTFRAACSRTRKNAYRWRF